MKFYSQMQTLVKSKAMGLLVVVVFALGIFTTTCSALSTETAYLSANENRVSTEAIVYPQLHTDQHYCESSGISSILSRRQEKVHEQNNYLVVANISSIEPPDRKDSYVFKSYPNYPNLDKDPQQFLILRC